MKRQLTSILLFSALLVGGASTFVSCKDYESDALYETNGKVAEAVAQHAKDIKDLSDQLKAEAEKRESEDGILKQFIIDKAEEVSQAAQAAQATADQALAKANANATEIANLQTKLTSLESQLTALTELERRLGVAENKINDLQNQINNIKSCECDYTAMNDRVVRLEDAQQEDERRLQALEEGKTTLEEQIRLINANLDTKASQTDLDALKQKVEENRRIIDQNTADINDLKSKYANCVSSTLFNEKIDNITQAQNQIKQAMETANTELKGDITDLEKKLTEQLNNLFNAMASMVTNIELQATESPISGYENLSFLGVEAHILGTYYSYAAKPLEFNGFNVEENDLLIENNGQNAGVVYVTINPSNVDFSGLKFKIVDSQGNEAPFTATAYKSDRLLTYGVSRAGESNLYALKINIDPARLNEAKTWTREDAANLKDAAKNVLNKLKDRNNNLNLTQVATTIEGSFNNRLVAYGLQLKQDVTDGSNTTTRYITSKLSLAATALTPLSYEFLKNGINYHIKDIPTLEEKGIYVDKSNFEWSDIDKIDPNDPNFQVTVDVPDPETMTINGKKVHIDASGAIIWTQDANGNDIKESIDDLKGVQVTINGITFDADAIHYDTKKQTVKLDMVVNEFNKIIDQVNSQVGNMLGSVNDLADKINGYVNSIDGQLINRVNNYIHKCNYWLDNANKFLQPTMFATDGNKWAKLPTLKSGATYVKMNGGKANVILMATSYTGELIAPAYKKFIKVTGPNGENISGTRLNQVLNGSIHKAWFTATKPGIYTIQYDAMDYAGVTVTRTYYVKVVE